MALKQFDVALPAIKANVVGAPGSAIGSSAVRVVVDDANVTSKNDVLQALAVVRQVVTEDTYPLTGGGAGALPTLRDLALYDINFADADYKGGIQPDGYNPTGTDNRFFRVSATSSQPNYTPSKGGKWTSTSLVNSTLRRSDRGAWVESQIGTGDNPILWTRDLTQAAWVKTNCTAFKDQPGRVLPVVANAASRIVVGADGATVLQSTTRAITNPFSFAFDMRRISGAGTVEYTVDGGTTWTAITPDATLRPFFMPPVSGLLDPVVGFRFGTAGDQFEIDMVRGSKFAYPHTPLIQTSATATQWFDRYTSGIAGGTNGAYSSGMMEFIRDNVEWGVYGEWFTAKTGAQFNIFGLLLAVQADGKITCETKGTGGGVTTAAGTARVSTTQYLEKNNRALVWTIGTTTYLCVNGGAILEFPGRTLGTYTALDHKDAGGNGAGSLNLDGVIPRLAIIGPSGLSSLASIAQTVTTPVDYVSPV